MDANSCVLICYVNVNLFVQENSCLYFNTRTSLCLLVGTCTRNKMKQNKAKVLTSTTHYITLYLLHIALMTLINPFSRSFITNSKINYLIKKTN